MCHNSTMKGKVDISLLLKYFKCKTDKVEEEAVMHWLANDLDGSHAKLYYETRTIFEGLVLNNVAETDVKTITAHKSVVKKIVLYLSNIAAVVAIVLFSCYMGSRIFEDRLSSKMETISVPRGKSMHMTLADGTSIWLNSGTELEIPVIFSRNSRKLRLNSGEVFFEVKKDAHKPFIVDTYAGDITVLGTKFNVKVDPDKEYFYTSLVEGSVKIQGKGDNAPEFIMKPNDIVKFSNKRWTVGHFDNPESVTCWKEGLIDIAGVNFEELMSEFEKVFDIKVVIERDKAPVLGFTRGKIRVSDGVDYAFHVLSMASDFTFEKDNATGTVYIR